MARATALRSLVCVCVLLAVSGRAGLFAEQVSVNLALAPPSEDTNVLTMTLTFQGFGIDANDAQAATMSGMIGADLTAFFDEVTWEAVIAGLEFVGGEVFLSDVSLYARHWLLGGAHCDGSDIAGTLETPLPSGMVSGDEFPAEEHALILSSGVLDVDGTGLVGSLFTPFSVDLTAAPITAAGQGTGLLIVSPPAIVGMEATYDVMLDMPVCFERLLFEEEPVTIALAGSGLLRAGGQFTRIIPEPASALLFAALGALAGPAGLPRGSRPRCGRKTPSQRRGE